MYQFVNVEPCYTGGGIYCFVGELKDGRYFVGSDTHFDITIVDEQVYHENEEQRTNEWLDEHLVKYLESPDETIWFYKSMLNWIIENTPKGNYIVEDMLNILERIKQLESEENWR